jgi:hypothetical protein
LFALTRLAKLTKKEEKKNIPNAHKEENKNYQLSEHMKTFMHVSFTELQASCM